MTFIEYHEERQMIDADIALAEYNLEHAKKALDRLNTEWEAQKERESLTFRTSGSLKSDHAQG